MRMDFWSSDGTVAVFAGHSAAGARSVCCLPPRPGKFRGAQLIVLGADAGPLQARSLDSIRNCLGAESVRSRTLLGTSWRGSGLV